jgi:hypothetical protein
MLEKIYLDDKEIQDLLETMNRSSKIIEVDKNSEQQKIFNQYEKEILNLGLEAGLKTCIVNKFEKHSQREIYISYLRQEANLIYSKEEYKFSVFNELEFLNDNLFPVSEYTKSKVIYFKNLFTGSVNQYNRNKYLLLWERLFDLRKSRIYIFETSEKEPIEEVKQYLTEIME